MKNNKDKMKFEDLIKLYEKKKEKYGENAYRYISELLKEAKDRHKKGWKTKKTALGDHEQSWRAFKGKNLEKLIMYIIKDEIEKLKLMIIDGNKLDKSKNLTPELENIKRNLAIDFGEFGLHLPDVDLIIYNPKNKKIIAVISSKVTLRERIAQTGYWKIKLSQSQITRHIKVYFFTLDEDGTLTYKCPCKKGRAIVEVDLDGSYVLTENNIEESEKVKLFDKFIDDLKKVLIEGNIK